MKISEYKINKFNPDSCGELITTVNCKHYGFTCEGKLYTCNGELDNDYIVTAKIKMVCKWKKKNRNKITSIYDSVVKDVTDENIGDFIMFCFKTVYDKCYKD